jgi:alkaline phosphatase D
MKTALPPSLALTRRHLLQSLGATAAAALAVSYDGRSAVAQGVSSDYPFQLGVAAGDPMPDGFVIWTRLCPRPLEPHYGMGTETVNVDWEIAADLGFQKVEQKGTAAAYPELGHAVHVEVAGLEPGRTYYYRFRTGRHRSILGRARTAPAPGARLDKLRFASVGCQHYEQGFFTAYNYLAREDLDFVYHYGDYIYEGLSRPFYEGRDRPPSAVPRLINEPECYSLDDYRRRHAVYKMDTDLQLAHASAAWIVTWDDHEIVNNWAADKNAGRVPDDIFRLRRAAAAQAYYEHMPLRRSSLPAGPGMQLFRGFSFGDLLDVHALDTRQYRTPQPCRDGFKAACGEEDAATAAMLGDAQEAWLFERLTRSKARWNALAQQVMMMPCDREPGPSVIHNMDSWSGYNQPRARLLKHLHSNKIVNAVVLTGDEHQHYAGELPLDCVNRTGPVVATELVSTSISSGHDGVDQRPATPGILADNPHIKMICDLRGYLLCEVTPKRFLADFKTLNKVSTRDGVLSSKARYALDPQKPGLSKA